MMDELRELFRYGHIVLAIVTPLFFAAAILLRDSSEAVLQALELTYFFLLLVVPLRLERRAKRRQRRNQ